MRSERIATGILLVVVGVLIALSSFGVIPAIAGISPWQIILGVALLWVVFKGIINLDFFNILVFLGFELMLFEEPIGKLLGMSEANWINNWIVFLVTMLVGFGLNLIFRSIRRAGKKRRKHGFRFFVNDGSDHLRYIDCAKFKTASVRNHFGDYDVRFENADSYGGEGVLEVENSFGDVTVYVPSSWEVRCEIENSFGDVEVDRILTTPYGDGTPRLLVIKGKNKFGDVTIKAI